MATTDRMEADFDHQSLEWLQNRHAHNDELREKGPAVWNPHYGGFWFVSGYEEVAAVARDSATFTPRYEENSPDGLRYIGIMGVPRREGMPPVGIAEAEGVHHAALRRMLNPFMLPSAVTEYRPFVKAAATWFMDQYIEQGAMDLVLDFTNPVPAVLTMKMIGLPCESWSHYGDVFHSTAAYAEDDPEYQGAVARVPTMVAELIEIAEERRKNPTGDVLTELVLLEVGGRRLSNDDIVAIMWNLIGGGLDTTTSLTSLALYHLDGNPELRRRLIDDPDLLVPACEEYLRWTSVNETLTRTCTRDTEIGGQLIRRGDFVMMSWLGANFDPTVFDRPYDVNIDRAPNPHLSFGLGTHRCVGMHVARSLFLVMMSEILTRIPDYAVDREATRFYQGNPELYGVVRMPVTFTPGTTVGGARPF